MFFETMSLIRYNHLTEVADADLMVAEKILGWHFCDGKLVNKNDPAFINHKCDCKPFKQEDEDADVCM